KHRTQQEEPGREEGPTGEQECVARQRTELPKDRAEAKPGPEIQKQRGENLGGIRPMQRRRRVVGFPLEPPDSDHASGWTPRPGVWFQATVPSPQALDDLHVCGYAVGLTPTFSPQEDPVGSPHCDILDSCKSNKWSTGRARSAL